MIIPHWFTTNKKNKTKQKITARLLVPAPTGILLQRASCAAKPFVSGFGSRTTVGPDVHSQLLEVVGDDNKLGLGERAGRDKLPLVTFSWHL